VAAARPMKRLVLLGAGHAHLHVLRSLAGEALASAEVTLVSPHPALVYSGMVPGCVAGHYAAAECRIAIAPLAARAGVRFVQRAAIAVRARERRIELVDGSHLSYDVLSLDIGAVMDRDAIAGAREHALFVRPIEDLESWWQALLVQAPRTPASVVIVGGGAAGFELALAMQHRLGAQTRLCIVAGGPLLANHAAGVRRLATRALTHAGIELLERTCASVDALGVVLADGRRVAGDAMVMAIGASAPAWLRGSGLALDADGFVATGPTLQSTSHAEVFAAGDVASRADAPRPRSGVYAVRAGPPLALNLRRFFAGAALRRYRPQRRALNLLACGERRAILSWGPLAAEGRWAWRWKDRIDRGFVAGFRAQAPA